MLLVSNDLVSNPKGVMIMEKLLMEYKQSLKQIRKAYHDSLPDSEDRAHLASMMSDLQYAIDWVRCGHQPGNRRGIERYAAYQREKSFDPLMMQKYFKSESVTYEWDDHQQVGNIDEWDKERISDALSVLTEKEKEVYLMKRGQCLTYADIANYLCISTSSVQTMIERADKKIAKRKDESLFCLVG